METNLFACDSSFLKRFLQKVRRNNDSPDNDLEASEGAAVVLPIAPPCSTTSTRLKAKMDFSGTVKVVSSFDLP